MKKRKTEKGKCQRCGDDMIWVHYRHFISKTCGKCLSKSANDTFKELSKEGFRIP